MVQADRIRQYLDRATLVGMCFGIALMSATSSPTLLRVGFVITLVSLVGSNVARAIPVKRSLA